MRESRTSGSVRGAPSNRRPYRDPPAPATGEPPLLTVPVTFWGKLGWVTVNAAVTGVKLPETGDTR